MSYDNKIKELKIVLPEAKPPVGNYVATKISGKMLFVSGQISIDENGQLIKGKIGKDLNTEDALAINIPALIPLPDTSAKVK